MSSPKKKLALKEELPPVKAPVSVQPSGDTLLAAHYPNTGDSIPGLLKAILKELLLMRYRYEHR